MNQSVLRLTRELSEIQKSNDLSLAVACRDIDVRNVKALITGPPDTPYEFGFFEFTLKFPKDYPAKAPAVNAITTNGGRCRFNPNIYANGKVCLSILGTWRGERGEEWSSAQGLESILISIQSLMSSNPYENEPGFETSNSEQDKECQKVYVAKIRHETLRISIIQRMEEYLGIKADGSIDPVSSTPDLDPDSVQIEDMHPPFEPFRDLCKRRFLWYFDSYMLSIETETDKYADQESFTKMPFENSGNSMDGRFNYTDLKRRLLLIRKVLDQEIKDWAVEGLLLKQREFTVAANLQRQFEQTKEHYKKSDTVTLDLELEDGNPFVWRIAYFGRPMTNLDGGLFQLLLHFSPRFPEEWPRAKFLTPMFHYRISKDGIPFYFPRQFAEARSHIEAIVAMLEEEDPAYDPRGQLNMEAAKLYWGSKDEKKEYNKRLRRAVQRSMDYDV